MRVTSQHMPDCQMQGRPPGLFNTLKAYTKSYGGFFWQLRGNVRIFSQFLTCSSSAANELQVKQLTTIPNIPPELSEKSPKIFVYAARWWLDVTSLVVLCLLCMLGSVGNY
jgi:hypothetical protein